MEFDSIFRDTPESEADEEFYEDEAGEEIIDDPEEAVNGLFDSTEQVKSHPIRNTLVVLLCLALVGGIAFVGFTKGRDLINTWSAKAPDYEGSGGEEVIITIPKGSGASAMAKILFEADVVKSEESFTEAVKVDPVTFDEIQAGKHLMLKQMPAAAALTRLADSQFVQRMQVTVPEGYTVARTFARINEVTGISIEDLNAVAAEPSELGLPEWAVLKGDDPLEGFLFPETYAYEDNSTATTMLKLMVVQFNRNVDGLEFAEQAKALGYKPYEALVVASIIQCEGAYPEYAQDIAQVIYNRLKAKMLLQMDSTVHYAINNYGSVWTSPEQRKIDSPYNTYLYKGLPPGPIANPGTVALSAAVNPTQGKLLFFCTVNLDTGETKFATTDKGHEENRAELRAWCNANAGRC